MKGRRCRVGQMLLANPQYQEILSLSLLSVFELPRASTEPLFISYCGEDPLLGALGCWFQMDS